MRHARGFNLLEITIALALGLTLLAAFLVVLQRCRAVFAADESLARLQDTARNALAVVVPDIELAGFYGFTNQPAARLIGALPSGIHACGTNFATTLAPAAQGSDNLFRLGADARDCAPTASAHGARPGADTLTLRHASRGTAALHTGQLQVYSQRFESTAPILLFADGRAPGPVDVDHEVRDLEVRTYYIAASSVDRPEWPALRVKALTESGGAAQFRDEEVAPGVEDLQVELGVASRAEDGTLRLHFVAPDVPRAREEPIVAVRIWLRIRADATEPGFEDDRGLTYANVHFVPSAIEGRQRRLLVERTVALRNARPP
ncbi:MAG TPA: PilW family protein [Steroidobacteraceae bacterium]|jgi:type IV pilus assembly protein PilW|nr:PilW family protein [Steroidobacteraceae bacterium]